MKRNFNDLKIYQLCLAPTLIVFLLGSILRAENESLVPAATNNTLTERLPLPDAQLSNGATIGGFDDQLINLVIPELRDFVRDGQFSGAAFSSLPFALQTGVKCCQENGEPLSVSDSGLLSSVPQNVNSLFFPSPQDLALNTASLGYGTLWNAQALWLTQNFVSTDVRLRYIRNDSVFRELKGQYSLVFPRQFNQQDATQQIFREMFQVQQPGLVKDFSWLRFRFYVEAEDAIFMYSPVVKKVRELTASNGSDALLSSSVALDDFFVWSQKINTVDILAFSEDVYLMPVVLAATGSAASPLKAGECRQLTNPEFDMRDQATWSYQARRYAGSAPWLLNQSVYVPRTLLRLFLKTNDPYSLYGRQILYIDKETGLPIYKIVFDNAGQIWKIIIGNFAFSAHKDSAFPFYPYAQVVIDYKTPQIALLEFLTYKTCGTSAAAKELAAFAPQKLVPQ